MIAIRKLPLAAFIAAMVALGGARAAGGVLFMSAFGAREALSRGKESPLPYSEAAARLRFAATIWPYDARAWDALGALSLEAAFANDGAIQNADAGPAIAAFEQATLRAPGQPLFWMRRAAAHRAAGGVQAAAGDLEMSLRAGAFHPQAMQFRFQLGLALWPELPADARRGVALQGAGALRQGKEGLRFVARTLRAAPPDLRSGVFSRLTPQERIDLIGAMRRI